MGKAVKNPPRSPAPPDTPNRETRQAIEAVRRGNVETAKNAGDLLNKLKS